MLFKQEVVDYSNDEVEKVFGYLKRYLKTTGETLEIDGRRIKYIDYLETHRTKDTSYGFEDELVYVCDTYRGNEKVEDTYIGMHERHLSCVAKREFLKDIPKETLEQIIISQMASKVIYEYNTKGIK
ncbi:hypothetical protein UT300012_23550 [Paraclostridium bifermentans]